MRDGSGRPRHVSRAAAALIAAYRVVPCVIFLAVACAVMQAPADGPEFLSHEEHLGYMDGLAVDNDRRERLRRHWEQCCAEARNAETAFSATRSWLDIITNELMLDGFVIAGNIVRPLDPEKNEIAMAYARELRRVDDR